MSFFVGSAARRAAPPFGISMLGAANPPLRQGFACGKTLVRRTRAAGQKAGWWFFCNGPAHPKYPFQPSLKKDTTYVVSFFGEEGRSVSGRGLQAQDAHQEQGGEEEPGGGGRFLEQDDAGDQGPQGADSRPDGVGGPQREHLGGLGEKGGSVNPWENFMQVDQNTSITPAMHK